MIQLLDCINDLLRSGAVQPCQPVPGQFISSIFLVPKPNGSMSFILILIKLNVSLKYDKFKLEDLRTACRLVHKNCYMASIDLKDAYFLIPIHNTHRKYLRLSFNNVLYEFTCLPFGFGVALLIFTEFLRPVVACLRERGNVNVIYIDDLLIIGASQSECTRSIIDTVNLLHELGLLINVDKSVLFPVKEIKYDRFLVEFQDVACFFA